MRGKIILVFFLGFALVGCSLTVGTKFPTRQKTSSIRTSTVKGVYHIVKKGENLYRIAKYYQVSIESIKKANNLTDDTIEVEQKLFIPGTKKPVAREPLLPPVVTKVPSEKTTAETQITGETKPIIKDLRFIWPVNGKVICKFGELDNKGIDIMCEPGEFVVAVGPGKVSYAEETKRYGMTIIIEHPENFYSVYGGHYLELKTKKGDIVKQDDKIGQIITGSGKKYLHFELRKGSEPVNPAEYLP